MRTVSKFLATIAAFSVLSACTSGEDDDNTDLWTDAGLYRLIVAPQADPQVAGDAVLAIGVQDVDAVAVEGATLTVTPWMPSMSHGVTDVVITEPSPGQYEAAFAYSMPGAWEVTIEVNATAGVDQAVVSYDIQ